MTEPIDALHFIDSIRNLPALPTVAAHVIEATTGGQTSVKEVSDLIEKDIALTARLLQVVNSSLYGFSREIDSVADAVSLMGFRQVGNLALGISVAGSFARTEVHGFSFPDLWKRSLSSAVGAVLTASGVPGLKDSGVFTAALLQDIGTCVLVSHLPLAYGTASGMARERGIHPVHTEREMLGTDHAEIGARLAEKWNLPAAIRSVIRHHHFTETDPDLKLNGEGNLIRAVCLSSLIPRALYDADGPAVRATLQTRARLFFRLPPRQIDEMLDKVPQEVESVRSLFDYTETEAESEEDLFHADCPRCGSRSVIRYCGACGTSLLKTTGDETSAGPEGKILVAEDSEAIRTAVVSLLRKRGYRVVVALDGEEAANTAGKEKPDLVLMDIRMPIVNGIEALRRIRADVRTSGIPVVMLTSVTGIDTVTEAINAGANDYVAKPFTIRKLLSTVEKYASRARPSGPP